MAPSCRPRGTQQTTEIPPEHRLNVRIAIAATDQGCGEIVDLARMIESVRIDLVPESIRGFVSRLQLFVLIGRHVIVPHQIGVGTYADMIYADEFDHMIDVIDDVLDRGWLLVLDEIAHAGDAHDAAFGRQLADGFIGLEARMI